MKAITNFPTINLKAPTSLLPFKIHAIQDMYEEYGAISKGPHSHDYFEIIWVIKGTGSYLVDMQKWEINTNRIFCSRPGQLHSFLSDETTEGFVISFTESFINTGEPDVDLTSQTNLFQLFLATNGIEIRNELVNDMHEIIIKMIKENNNSHLFKTDLVKRYFKIFLIYLTRHFDENLQAAIQSGNMRIVQKFMALLERNFKEKKMVTAYAADLCVTPNYLNEIIKKITGYPAGHHIRQRVVLETKRLALYSDKNMKEIAYELGFPDSCHFSKYFKAVTGKNFTDFRKEKIALSVAI